MVGGRARWALRDWLASAGLFFATAAVVLWQNAHVAVLWDLSYTLDSAARIAQGQLPYRDFPFVHAPLTFLIQAAIIRVTGRVFFHHVLYAAIVGGLGTMLAWRIALHSLAGRIKDAWLISLVLAVPLAVLGIDCILPFPSYDSDCVFALMVAIYLLQRLNPEASRSRAFLTGAVLCLPLFFKQNIGLPFLAAAIAILFVPVAIAFFNGSKSNAWVPPTVLACAGIATTLLAAALLMHFSVGIGNYFHWTIQFAAQRRLPGLRQMLGVYQNPQLLWALPCIAAAFFLLRGPLAKRRWAPMLGVTLLAAPFIYTLCTLLIYDDADERGDSLLALWPMLLILAALLALREFLPRRLRRQTSLQPLLPVAILAAIHGTLMSQQLWGSTYAIWPLLILLVAEMLAYLRSYVRPLAFIVAGTLLICGGFYTASEERLSYAQLPDGPVQHSTFPQLNGLSIAGPFVDDFDELLSYANAHISASDGLILLPGEDPFYFATGRTPQFPVLLFDPATDPLSPMQVVEAASKYRIRWLVVKRNLQLTANPMPQREATLNLLMTRFTLAAHLHAYDIYEYH